jgi:hypothetical protein
MADLPLLALQVCLSRLLSGPAVKPPGALPDLTTRPILYPLGHGPLPGALGGGRLPAGVPCLAHRLHELRAAPGCQGASAPLASLARVATTSVGMSGHARWRPPRCIGTDRRQMVACRQTADNQSPAAGCARPRQVHLSADETEHDIAKAAAAFPAATSAVLLLPNALHLRCNVFSSRGEAVTASPSAEQQTAGHETHAYQDLVGCRRLCESWRSVAGCGAARPFSVHSCKRLTRLRAPPQGPGEAATPAADVDALVDGALRCLAQHLPRLSWLQLGDSTAPQPRPGPLAGLAAGLPAHPCAPFHTKGDGEAVADGQAQRAQPPESPGLLSTAAARADTRWARTASAWVYPASLVPRELAASAVAADWDAPPGCDRVAAECAAAEQAVAEAHRRPLRLGQQPAPAAAEVPAATAAAAATAPPGGRAADPACAAAPCGLQALSAVAQLDVRVAGLALSGPLPLSLTALSILQVCGSTRASLHVGIVAVESIQLHRRLHRSAARSRSR